MRSTASRTPRSSNFAETEVFAGFAAASVFAPPHPARPNAATRTTVAAAPHILNRSRSRRKRRSSPFIDLLPRPRAGADVMDSPSPARAESGAERRRPLGRPSRGPGHDDRQLAFAQLPLSAGR
jgi:hypothetical protein